MNPTGAGPRATGRLNLEMSTMGNESRANRARAVRGGPAPRAAKGAEGALRPGFSLMEMLVVTVVIGFLLMMAIPSLAALAPHYMVRSSAKSLESMLQRGRLLANNSQKPTRVVVDCRAARQITDKSVCTIRLYVANFNKSGELAVTGGTQGPWSEVAESRREISRMVAVASPSPAVAANSPANVYWAVFLPTGRARTSHDPMRLVFSPTRGRAAPIAVSLSQYSGRTTAGRP